MYSFVVVLERGYNEDQEALQWLSILILTGRNWSRTPISLRLRSIRSANQLSWALSSTTFVCSGLVRATCLYLLTIIWQWEYYALGFTVTSQAAISITVCMMIIIPSASWVATILHRKLVWLRRYSDEKSSVIIVAVTVSSLVYVFAAATIRL